MNEVNKTLYIPLYGKAKISEQKIILNDPIAEKIWAAEAFPIKGKAKSKWLTYNMAMRAKVFDDWTDFMLTQRNDALVLHVGCGLDSRCLRVKTPYRKWIDGDLAEVIAVRKRYFKETETYQMMCVDATDPNIVHSLPDADSVIVVLEGISMYLSDRELKGFLNGLQRKYDKMDILMDVYTVFGAKASKFKNPVNDVGVRTLYGIDDMEGLLEGTSIQVKAEKTFTPDYLIDELEGFDRAFFKIMFAKKLYRKIYRLYELGTVE